MSEDRIVRFEDESSDEQISEEITNPSSGGGIVSKSLTKSTQEKKKSPPPSSSLPTYDTEEEADIQIDDEVDGEIQEYSQNQLNVVSLQQPSSNNVPLINNVVRSDTSTNNENPDFSTSQTTTAAENVDQNPPTSDGVTASTTTTNVFNPDSSTASTTTVVREDRTEISHGF